MLIYLIDDHKMFAEAMKTVIAECIPHSCSEVFTSADDALKALCTSSPDLIILDLEMNSINGLMLLDILAQSGKQLPVLVCSGNLTESNKQRVMSAGANGFLSKAQGSGEIREAITNILEGNPYPANADSYRQESEQAVLSNRQRVILTLMQSGMANADIADTLFLSTNTIKTHIRLMYNTLDVNSRIECLNKARELGLLDSL